MQIEPYVMAHPWRAIGAGFIVGAALAWSETSRSAFLRAASAAFGGWLVAGFQSVAKNKIAAAVRTASGSHSVS